MESRSARKEFRRAVDSYYETINFTGIENDRKRIEENPDLELSEEELQKHLFSEEDHERRRRLKQAQERMESSSDALYDKVFAEYENLERLESRQVQLTEREEELRENQAALDKVGKKQESGVVGKKIKEVVSEQEEVTHQIGTSKERVKELEHEISAHDAEEERQEKKLKAIAEADEDRTAVLEHQARVQQEIIDGLESGTENLEAKKSKLETQQLSADAVEAEIAAVNKEKKKRILILEKIEKSKKIAEEEIVKPQSEKKKASKAAKRAALMKRKAARAAKEAAKEAKKDEKLSKVLATKPGIKLPKYFLETSSSDIKSPPATPPVNKKPTGPGRST